MEGAQAVWPGCLGTNLGPLMHGLYNLGLLFTLGFLIYKTEVLTPPRGAIVRVWRFTAYKTFT